MPEFQLLQCQICGGDIEEYEKDKFKCRCCEKIYERKTVENTDQKLRALLGDVKLERISNLRSQLWEAMTAQYIDSGKIVDLSREIKGYLPDDYFANFCEVANSGNDKQVNAFLKKTSKENMADFATVVLDFMIKSLKSSNITAVSQFIEKAFKGDTDNYDKYTTALEREAEKVNHGIYELTLTRDVFLAYSSADMEKVIELCDFLESNNLTCFMALRNLRHGRGAVDNYDDALKQAMDNCKSVVFISSTNSRNFACDALSKELPYIRQKDIENAPAEYKHSYEKMPAEFKMPRVEYVLEDYRGDVAEFMTKEFFNGLEWCKSKEAVARRITAYLTEAHETSAEKEARIKREYEEQLKEIRRKVEEAANTPSVAAQATLNSLLKRADSERNVESFDTAAEYYNRVLEIQPDNGRAWYGMLLVEFECSSDEELFKRINKVDPTVKDSFRYLLDLMASKNLKQLAQYGEDEYAKKYNQIVNTCEDKTLSLCKEVRYSSQEFYRRVLAVHAEYKKPIKAYAAFALFILYNKCISEDELLDKFTKIDVKDSYSYDFLFTFKTGEYYDQLIQFAKDEITEKIQKITDIYDKKIFDLCSITREGGEDFYKKILHEDLDSAYPIKAYAAYSLFLLENECNANAQMLKKIDNCTDSEESVYFLTKVKQSMTRKSNYFEKALSCATDDKILQDELEKTRKALNDKIEAIENSLHEQSSEKEKSIKSLETEAKKHKGAKIKENTPRPKMFSLIVKKFGKAGIFYLFGVFIAIAAFVLTCWQSSWISENTDKFEMLSGAAEFAARICSSWSTVGELSFGMMLMKGFILAICSGMIIVTYIFAVETVIFIIYSFFILILKLISLATYPYRKGRYDSSKGLAESYKDLCAKLQAEKSAKLIMENKLDAILNDRIYAISASEKQ